MITDKEKQQAREERILLVANIIRNKLPFCVKHKQPGSVWKMSKLPITAFTHATAWQVSTDMSLVEPARPPEEAETPDRRKERRIARLKMIATVIATDRNFEVRTKGPAPAAWFSTNMPVEHYADVDRFDLRLITNPSRPEIERIERLYPGFGDAFKSYQPPQFIILDEMIKLADGEIEKLKAAGFKMTANGGCEHEVRARLIVKILDGKLPFEVRRLKTYPGQSHVTIESAWKKPAMSAAHYFSPEAWDMRLAEMPESAWKPFNKPAP